MMAGSFIPITLEQLAREGGTLLSDRSKPCSGISQHNPVSMPSGNGSLVHDTTRSAPQSGGKGQCIIKLMGADINTASFAMYTFSISVFVQALIIISMSGAADHGRYRKSLLLAFAFTGAIATMLFIVVVPEIYVFGALLAIIANVCFGASFVLLNSFLPILVRRHPSIQESGTLDEQDTRAGVPESADSRDDLDEIVASGPADALLHPDTTRRDIFESKSTPVTSAALQLSTKISSYGIGIGYLAAVIVQTLGIIIVVAMNNSTSTTFSLRIVLFFVGLWWFAFTIPSALWLRPRPGPPLGIDDGADGRRSWLGYTAYAWKALGKTVVRAGHLKDLLLFLAAWFMLSDAIATVSGTAVLFAKTDLEMQPAALALISLIGTLTGVVGAFSWSKLSRWMNLRPSQTIIACICLFEVIPLYGLLWYIPGVERLGFIGLQQPSEMYVLGAIYGFVLGGLSSYCRSLFGELIPPGSEAAFYALYAITDKGSSVFGPAIVGAITDRYGEIRPAFVFLAVLIFIPLPLMLLVDVDRGKKDGRALAAALEGPKQSAVPAGKANSALGLIVDQHDEYEGGAASRAS